MKRSNFILTGMFAMMLTFALVLVGCGGSDSGDPSTPDSGTSGATLERCSWWDNGATYTIELRCNQNITTATTPIADSEESRKGFTVTVNGAAETVSMAFCTAASEKVYVQFGDGQSLDDSAVVTIAYDGTGAFAGKLAPFTTRTVPLDD